MNLDELKKEARNKKTSAQRLLELAKMDVQLSRLIAKHKSTQVNVLEELAKSADMPTRAAVAKNPNSTSQIIDSLAHDKQWTVLKAVAEHPKTSDAVLKLLAMHSQYSVRQAVSARQNLSAQLMWTLSEDSDIRVISSLARWHSLHMPASLLEKLSLIQEEKVLHWVLHSGRLSSPSFKRLLLSGFVLPDQRLQAIISDKEILAYLASRPEESIRVRVAYSKHTPATVLEFLAKDSSWDVRREVAANHSTPPHVFNILINDPSIEVRSRLATNSIVSSEILTRLAIDPSFRVAFNAEQTLKTRKIKENE